MKIYRIANDIRVQEASVMSAKQEKKTVDATPAKQEKISVDEPVGQDEETTDPKKRKTQKEATV